MKKAINITLLSLLGACIVSSCVAYFVKPTETTEFFNRVIDFINKPLPIVGVSLVIVGGFAFKFFRESSLGKKQIAKIWDMTEKAKTDFNVQKVELENKINDLKIELENAQKIVSEQKAYIDEIAKTIPNKKVNELVAKYEK